MDNMKISCSGIEDPAIGAECRRSSSSIFARWLEPKPSSEKKYNTLPPLPTKPCDESNHASLFQRLFAYRLDHNSKARHKNLLLRMEAGNLAETTPSSTSEDKVDSSARFKQMLYDNHARNESQELPSTSEIENLESDRSMEFDKDCEVIPNLESPAYLHLKSMMDDSLARVQCQVGVVKESERFILCSMAKYLRNENTVLELSSNLQRHVSIMLTAQIESARTEQEMLKEQIDSHRIQTSHYKELITTMTNQLRELRQEKADLVFRFEQNKPPPEFVARDGQEMLDRNEELRKKIKELRDYIGTIQTALAELTAMVQNLQQRNRKLQTDNEYLKTWIERIDHDYTTQMDHMTRLVETNISHDPILALGTLSVELRTLNALVNSGTVTTDAHTQSEVSNMICNICETCHDTIKRLNEKVIMRKGGGGYGGGGIEKSTNVTNEAGLRRNQEILSNTNEKMQSLLKILEEYERKAKQWEMEKYVIEEQFKKEKEEHAEFLKTVSKRIDKLTQENEQLKELKCHSSSMLHTSKTALDQAQQYLNDQLKKIRELEDTLTDITRENNRLTLVAVYNKQLCEQLRSTIIARDEAIEQLRNSMQQCSLQLSEDNAEKIALCGEVEQLSEEKVALTDIIERLKEQTKRKLRQNESDKKALNEFSVQYKTVVVERDGLLEERVHLLNQVEMLKQRANRQRIKCENQVTTCYQLNMKVAELTEQQQKMLRNNETATYKTVSVQTLLMPLYVAEQGKEIVSYPALPIMNLTAMRVCEGEERSEMRCSCGAAKGESRYYAGVQQLCRCVSDTPCINSADQSQSRLDVNKNLTESKDEIDISNKEIYIQCSSHNIEELRSENKRLRTTLEATEDSIKELQLQLIECAKEKQATQDQLTAQTKLVTEMTEKSCEMTHKMKVTQSNNEHLMWELCQKDCRFNELKNEYRKYADKAEIEEKKHIAVLEEQDQLLKARDEEISILKEDLKLKIRTRSDLEAKLVDHDQVQSQLHRLQKQMELLLCERQRDLEKMEHQHLIEVEELRKDHCESYNRYIETVRDLTDQQTAGREALEQAQKALDRLEKKHHHLGERIIECVKLLVDEKMKSCDSEARRKEMTKLARLLECQMEGVDRHNSALMAECNDARRRLDELMEMQMSTHQLLQREQEEHGQTRNKLICLRTEIQDSRAKLQMATACECEMGRRLSEAQYETAKYEMFESRADQLKSNLYEKQSEVLQLKAQISDLQKEALKVNFTISQQKLEIRRLRGMVKSENASSDETCCSD